MPERGEERVWRRAWYAPWAPGVAWTVAAAIVAALVAFTVLTYDHEATGDRAATGALSDYRDAIYEPVRALADGVNPYDPEPYLAQRPVDQELPPYLPLNYLLFAPLVALPLSVAGACFVAGALAAVFATATVVVRAARWPRPWVAVPLLAAALLLTRPVVQAVQYGQVVPWVALALILAGVGWRDGRPGLVALGVAAAWAKPSLGLPFVIVLVLAAPALRRAAVWGSVVAFASGIPVGIRLLMIDDPAGLVGAFRRDLTFSADHPFGALTGPSRVDIASTVAKLTTWHAPVVAEAAMGVAVLAVSVLAVRRWRDTPSVALLVMALGALLSVWRQAYDLTVVVGLLAWFVADPEARRSVGTTGHRLVAAALGVAMVSHPFSLQAASRLGLGEGTTAMAAWTGVTGAAVLGAWAVAVFVAVRRRPPVDAVGVRGPFHHLSAKNGANHPAVGDEAAFAASTIE